ncbi:MAG TPA: Gfo/Idh/MocA family oxidoreductase [Bryobacteraceae bacterium]|nr:Gfo/Idh/MocA family oxidoreductase [Bryobacteraceae bacterium]
MRWTRRDLITTGALVGGAHLARAASDRIRVAVVGMGGRSRDHIREMSKIPGVELACFCDPDTTQMERRAAEFTKLGGTPPTLQQDLRRVLDDRSIDVVTIASCNHWHALSAIWALQAGKHVYVEKPVCHDMFSGRQMVAAARKYGRLAQGGTQRRSSGTVQRGIQALREGVIGDLYMARCVHYQKRNALEVREAEEAPSTLNWDLWLGPAPKQAFRRNLQPYNWHWFWDFGNGELGNNGVHFIDIARWGLNKRLPSRINSIGGRFGYKDQGQTPNTELSTFQFEDGTELVVEIRGRYSNRDGDFTSGVIFYGSKGYMTVDVRDRCAVYIEGRDTAEPELPGMDAAKQTSGGAATRAHFQNYFAALRANTPSLLAADIEEGYLSTAFCLLGNISYRLNRGLRFDPGTQRFTGDDEANRMLRNKYRAPFTIPDRV